MGASGGAEAGEAGEGGVGVAGVELKAGAQAVVGDGLGDVSAQGVGVVAGGEEGGVVTCPKSQHAGEPAVVLAGQGGRRAEALGVGEGGGGELGGGVAEGEETLGDAQVAAGLTLVAGGVGGGDGSAGLVGALAELGPALGAGEGLGGAQAGAAAGGEEVGGGGEVLGGAAVKQRAGLLEVAAAGARAEQPTQTGGGDGEGDDRGDEASPAAGCSCNDRLHEAGWRGSRRRMRRLAGAGTVAQAAQGCGSSSACGHRRWRGSSARAGPETRAAGPARQGRPWWVRAWRSGVAVVVVVRAHCGLIWQVLLQLSLLMLLPSSQTSTPPLPLGFWTMPSPQ